MSLNESPDSGTSKSLIQGGSTMYALLCHSGVFFTGIWRIFAGCLESCFRNCVFIHDGLLFSAKRWPLLSRYP